VRDLTHRILLIAGTTLLGAAVIYGAPSTPVWPGSAAPVRLASAADIAPIVAPVRVVLKRKSTHHTDSVKPNGASCPGANTLPAIPPANDDAGQSAAQNSPATAIPKGKLAVPCPPTGSDAQADIARGHAIATPEPLNSKQLIAPAPKTPG